MEIESNSKLDNNKKGKSHSKIHCLNFNKCWQLGFLNPLVFVCVQYTNSLLYSNILGGWAAIMMTLMMISEAG